MQKAYAYWFVGRFCLELAYEQVLFGFTKSHSRCDEKDKKIVVLCHAGIRSYSFGQWSLDNNLIDDIWNLEEGIDGWSKYVDQTIPRY